LAEAVFYQPAATRVTIHRIQAVSVYATQISNFHCQCRLWQKEQFAVLISRAEHCKDIIFVGFPEDTKSAIVIILERSSKWDQLIDNYLSSYEVLSHPLIRQISLQLHPFKPLYREIPTASCGYVYLLASIPKPRKCYVEGTDSLKIVLRRHNTGNGAEETKSTNLHPWGVYAFVCGFEHDDPNIAIQRRCDFLNALRYDLNTGPEAVFTCMQEELAQCTVRGMSSLVIVKCGERRQ
jgi:hypothetical protein